LQHLTTVEPRFYKLRFYTIRDFKRKIFGPDKNVFKMGLSSFDFTRPRS